MFGNELKRQVTIQLYLHSRVPHPLVCTFSPDSSSSPSGRQTDDGYFICKFNIFSEFEQHNVVVYGAGVVIWMNKHFLDVHYHLGFLFNVLVVGTKDNFGLIFIVASVTIKERAVIRTVSRTA